MHMAISQGSTVNCKLFPAQRQDCRSFEEVCQTWPWKTITHVVADRGYDTKQARDLIRTHGAKPVIPPRGVYVPAHSDLTHEDFYDTKTYRKRHVIERLFGRLKENKRIAMRFDKLDTTFISFIALALIKAYKLVCQKCHRKKTHMMRTRAFFNDNRLWIQKTNVNLGLSQ